MGSFVDLKKNALLFDYLLVKQVSGIYGELLIGIRKSLDMSSQPA